MDKLFFSGTAAGQIYAEIKDLPIVDYHCHLSPKEIWEDRKFENLYQLWLEGDHYKWRLMRICGIDEELITGSGAEYDKYAAFVRAINLAPGNPLYHWVHLELAAVFGIDEPLTEQNAAEIWNKTAEICAETELSARKLIARFGVEYIATTDDPADEIRYHHLLAEDTAFNVKVCPTYRLDNLLLALKNADTAYLAKLGKTAGVAVTDAASLLHALQNRLADFVAAGCTISDVGVAFFPQSAANDAEANQTVAAIVNGKTATDAEFDALQGWLYRKAFAMFAENHIVLQLHTGVMRNASSRLFRTVGPDAGGDCIGQSVPIDALGALLDDLDSADALPRTIIYTLSPTAYAAITTLIGGFRGVTLGAAWWFCDHLNGIREQLEYYAALSALGTFTGMLTDSRSFTSYVRHDYFRQILADFLGDTVDRGQFPLAAAVNVARNICYDNPNKLTKGENQ